MLKKRILAIGLAMMTVLESSMVVSAADHVHDFKREMYSYSYTTSHSHRYVWGKEESGAPLYAQCDYIIRYHVLDMYCAYCDTKSPNPNAYKTVNTGSWEHDCPGGRK